MLNLLEALAGAAPSPDEEKELKRHLTSTIIALVTKHDKVAKVCDLSGPMVREEIGRS